MQRRLHRYKDAKGSSATLSVDVIDVQFHIASVELFASDVQMPKQRIRKRPSYR